MYAPVAAKARALRSSPTLEGRCCPGATRNHAGHPLVAILTDPGGPVLPADSCRPRTARSRCCDPHRPWRAGAARMGGTRARAVVQGCDPHRPWRAGAARKIRIEVVDERYVAILTDPGGPVLLAMDDATKAYLDELRSSPTLEGRCCCARSLAGSPRQRRVAILTDPGGPVLLQDVRTCRCEGECVAILTDPGGPVLPSPPSPSTTCSPKWLRSSPTLEGRCCWEMHRDPVAQGDGVAILTDPGGPVLRTRPRRSGCSRSPCCDPHRPWRAGAACPDSPIDIAAVLPLRSSPTLEGRCCYRMYAPVAAKASALRSSPTLEGRCCHHHHPRRRPARPSGCDPHRPWRAGAAGKCTGTRSPRVMGLRSSPTLEGRCCVQDPAGPGAAGRRVAILTDPGGPVLPAPTGRSISPRSCRCDPHRPWRAGAATGCTHLSLRRRVRCDPHRPWRAGAAITTIPVDDLLAQVVAILTDPGGPVLLGN